MKIFATNYLELMSEDIDGENDWNWNPSDKTVASKKFTKSRTVTYAGCRDSCDDTDVPAGTDGMMVA